MNETMLVACRAALSLVGHGSCRFASAPVQRTLALSSNVSGAHPPIANGRRPHMLYLETGGGRPRRTLFSTMLLSDAYVLTFPFSEQVLACKVNQCRNTDGRSVLLPVILSLTQSFRALLCCGITSCGATSFDDEEAKWSLLAGWDAIFGLIWFTSDGFHAVLHSLQEAQPA